MNKVTEGMKSGKIMAVSWTIFAVAKEAWENPGSNGNRE